MICHGIKPISKGYFHAKVDMSQRGIGPDTGFLQTENTYLKFWIKRVLEG